MSDRVRVRPLPTNQLEAIGALWEMVGDLADKVADLEARTGSLPGDYRFSVNGAGEIVITRVSTGGTAVVAPPL